MATAYAINGFTIGGKAVSSGMYLLEGTEYAPALAPRRAVIETAGTHYAIPQWNDPLSQVTVALKIRLTDVTPENLAFRWDTLMSLLGMGTNQPVTLTRVRGIIEEMADAQLVSMTTPDFSCPSNRLDTTIIFNVPGGSWRGPETFETYFNGTASLPNALASTVPIVDSLLLLKGPATSLTVTDNTSGTTIFWGDGSSTVSSAQWLLIDPRYMRARLHTSESWSLTTGTNVTGALEFRGNGPLTFTSRGAGAFGNRSGTFTVTTVGGNNGVQVRSKYAVI